MTYRHPLPGYPTKPPPPPRRPGRLVTLLGLVVIGAGIYGLVQIVTHGPGSPWFLLGSALGLTAVFLPRRRHRR